MKPLSKILVLSSIAGCLYLSSGASSAQECLSEFGGSEYCSAPQPGPWSIDACDEAAASTPRLIAWCGARGGTWNGSDCIDPAPFTEGNVGPFSVAFANAIRSSSCQLAGDTGWHTTYSTSFCTGGADNYAHGRLILTSRRISVTCDSGFGETISVTKSRGLSCPPGTTSTLEPFYGELCIAKLEDCPTCPKYGNPVTPSTGVKVQTETDYRNPHGLEITRHYHSFRFHDAYSNVQNSHVESGLGIVWRTSYDKRLIRLSPHDTLGSPGRYARADANGDIQVFGANGSPFIIYRGAPGTLAIVAGTGYYYNDPDFTEFYDTSGRLRSITRPNGQAVTLTYSDGTTSAPNGGFLVDQAGNPSTLPMPANLLIRVSDAYGNSLSFAYGTGERIIVATEPGGGRHLYAYDALNNLVSVTYPDTRVREYRYNEPAGMTGGANLPHALTSIVDENGAVFASFKYDPQGRAVETEHAGGVNRYQITYNSDGSSTAIDPLNTTRTLGYSSVGRVQRYTGASLPGMAGAEKAATYASSGLASSRTDFNNNVTCYGYLAGRHLESVRVEGLPAATTCASVLPNGASLPAGSRKILTEWHPRFRLPARISEPGRRTTFAYNGDTGVSCEATGAVIADGSPGGTPIAVLCSKTVQATSDLADGAQGFFASLVGSPRTWTYTYSATGQVLTMDGPRTDLTDTTAYTYDTAGNVTSITNAASQTTQVTAYNAHGQPLGMTDPNGLNTTLTYDDRQRLTSVAVGFETTTYQHDGAGQLTRVTLPDSSFLRYTYDAAHRLTDIEDNLGNRVAYTLDVTGNRLQEQVFGSFSILARTRSRVYNGLNRLVQEIGAVGQTTTFGYDDQGNLTSLDGPLSGTADVSTNAYDPLNRLFRTTDPSFGQVNYGYDGLDQLTSVSDPRSLVTSYSIDGLGNLNQQQSPDTGQTTSTFDDAGNLLTSVDAKGQQTQYAYDALNRVTSITYQGGVVHAFQYDQGANGIGRLTQITEPNSTTQYAYDQRGRLTSETRTINGILYTTGYSYDSMSRLTAMTYPSGRSLTYTHDALGRIRAIHTLGLPVVTDVVYRPFGPVESFAFGNAQAYTRLFDQDGRISGYTLATQFSPQTFITVGYDPASRVDFLGENNPGGINNTYSYDLLDRLTDSFQPGPMNYGFTYDSVGNRLSGTKGSSFDTYSYDWMSNRLSSITPSSGPMRTYVHDANGSVTSDGTNTYAYDARGRMVDSVSAIGTTNYQVNALGQRIRKTSPLGDTIYHYDSQGRLIAESSPAGAVQREYVYLGDVPVAVLDDVGTIYFIHVDHLNTPRLVTNQAGQALWRWHETEPFGANPPDENPSGLGTFVFNLRFPGQYFDKETNLHYNYFRDYDPSIGRYGESDPIGLVGGINTYNYAHDPLTQVDPFALMGRAPGGGSGAGTSTYFAVRRSGSCGAQGGVKFPDEWVFFGTAWNFRGPCNQHDDCYTFGCDPRSKCDDDFYTNLIAQCQRIPPSSAWGFARSVCRVQAFEFYSAVVIFGRPNYNASGCLGCPTK